MPNTISFGPVTLNPGTRDFGPANLADSDTNALLTIDRTIPGGFNSLTASTTCQISIYQSNDGGNTWDQRASSGFQGGIIINRGQQANIAAVSVSLAPGTGRQARAEVVIAGSAVAVQGTLAIT